MTTAHAAAVQATPVAFDLQRVLDRALDLAAQATRQGAQLLVSHGAFVSGYPRGLDFGARIGSCTDEGREWSRR